MPAARTLPAPKSARHIAIAQAREAVAEATENYAYWRRQAAVRINPKTAAEAAALRGAWQSTRIDCGSGIPFGICPVCKRGHGWLVFQRKEATCG